jgi:chemotaxis signal transduction protein
MVKTAAELRELFDESFSQAPSSEPTALEELLLVRVHDNQLALRLGQIAGVLRCPPLTALPSANPALLGLTGVRGALVAVYSLARLMGGQPAASSNGSIVLCASDRSVALLFDELIGVVSVASEAVHTAETKMPVNTGELVTIGNMNHIVISIPELLDGLLRTATSGRERV